MVSCVKVNHYNLQVILKLERREVFLLELVITVTSLHLQDILFKIL